MPVPNPKKDESKERYIARCSSFLHEENKGREEKRTNEQIQAICHNTWERKSLQRTIKFLGKPKFIQLGNALLIEGVLIEPGVYTGLDGIPTNYSKDFIRNRLNMEPLIGQPIKFAHKISDKSMLEEIPKGESVGFWTGVKGNGTCDVRGYIFEPTAIKYVKENPHIGLSMEAGIHTEYEASLGIEDAKQGALTGGVLISDPACPTCTVRTLREIELEKMKGVLNVTGDLAELEAELEEFDEKAWDEKFGKNPFVSFVEKKELAEPTMASFFEGLAANLKAAEIPEKMAGLIVRLVKKATTTPLEFPKLQENLPESPLEGKELLATITAKLKGLVPDEVLPKVLAALKPQEKPDEKPSELAQEFSEMKETIKTLEDERTAEREAAVAKVLGQVKELDPDFNEKILESFKCPDARKVFLEHYLATLKKNVKPIQLQIGEEKAKTQVAEVVKNMFGDSTFESIFDIKEGTK